MADENDARQQTMNAHINTVKDQLDYTMKNKNDAREWQREDVAYLISLAERAEQNRNVLTTSVSAKWLRDAAERVNNSLNAAAAVTQERDALRRHLEWTLGVIWEEHHVGEGVLDVAFVSDSDKEEYVAARAAAEESQPK